MEISIKKEELQKKSLFVATPMYGGQCHGLYMKACLDLQSICMAYGIQVKFSFLFNESLITRARNYLADEFIHRSDCTHMLFLDSDIHFNPQDVIALLALNKEVIGGPYPKKAIKWRAVKKAMEKNPEIDVGVLEKLTGDYVFNPVKGTAQFNVTDPLEVLEIGTGFMMVTKKAMKKFAESYSQYMYKPDHVRTEHFDGSREILMAFQAEVDPKSKRYLSEDYWFCQKAQEINLKTWFCPWMKMQHVGTYIFGGSLADLASIGVSATADPGALKKKK